MSYETITAEPQPVVQPVRPTGTNGMAIASFVLGLLWLGGLGSLLAVVFGVIGRRQTRETGQGGKGLATWGLALGIIGLVGAFLWIVFIVVAAGGAVSAADAYQSCIDAAQTVAEMGEC
jgi:hypothetical protein